MPNPGNKPVIAVDIDDVLVPHVQDLIAWHNREYGTKMNIGDYRSQDPSDWGAETIQIAIKRVQRFFDTPDFLESTPLKQAYEVLSALSTSYDLIIITARDNIIEDVTRDWLNRHFVEIFKEVHFTARFNLNGDKKSKADIALNAKATYLIDDSLENILGTAEVGLKFLLFGDYPWNRSEELPKGVTRVKNWQEVLEYFEN